MGFKKRVYILALFTDFYVAISKDGLERFLTCQG